MCMSSEERKKDIIRLIQIHNAPTFYFQSSSFADISLSVNEHLRKNNMYEEALTGQELYERVVSRCRILQKT